jgi:hypothetical protein
MESHPSKVSVMRVPILWAISTLALGAAGGAISSAAFRPIAEVGVRDRLTAHRLDIVDGNGVSRLVLSAPTPDPRIDGVRIPRRYPVSGIAIYDAKGSERGGIGITDIPGGAPVLALDHKDFDAIGWKVLPDGSVDFGINSAGAQTVRRIRVHVAADGTPDIDLSDKDERPRLRLTVDRNGLGAIQFLDRNGTIIRSLGGDRL